jgi:hypothetical protein
MFREQRHVDDCEWDMGVEINRDEDWDMISNGFSDWEEVIN